MKKNKLTPIEVVERYHKQYLEYEVAFNKDPFTEKDRQQMVVELANSGVDVESEEFLNKMTEAMVAMPHKMADVNNSAAKFIMFVEFYLLTEEKELPENIMKDYNSLPIKETLKPFHSIENEQFIKNEDKEIDEATKDYFKQLVEQIKMQ